MSTSLDTFREFFAKRMLHTGESHFNTLGFTSVEIDVGKAKMELPYQDHLIGHPETLVMADGAMIALLDSCCAIAAATIQKKIAFCPTLDLRVDHMGMAVAGQSLFAEADVYRHTSSVIFTRGTIYQDDRERPIMRALINFSPTTHTIMDTSGAPIQSTSGSTSESALSDGDI